MRAAAVAGNMRLAVGLAAAWLLSLAAMAAGLRRLPARLVLLRRRLRSSAGQGGASARAPEAASLLAQNNALPGNRAGGFRFDHLRLMIVLTPLYLWLELAFGVSLLDKMGSSLPIDETAAVEHWGRLISGLALALVFLKTWFQQCEKWDRAWPVRLAVSLAIVALSVAVMWQVQDAVIEFHVTRPASGIAIGLGSLALVLVAGGWLVRAWLTRSMANRRRGVPATLAGLVVFSAIGVGVLAYLGTGLEMLARHAGFEERFTRDLGLERQRAARLTVIRRGLQLGHYRHETLPVTPETADSAEGKAALALFPVIAAGLDIRHFAADQERVVTAIMFHDWDRENGEPAYAAYQDAEREVAGMPPEDPAVLRHLRMAAACLDCAFRPGMTRDEYNRELHKWTEAQNVRTSLGNLDSPDHFETGRDGESAARTYWVPIWALLFSMVGAVVHLFKLAFTVTEYVQRRAFHAVGAADSPLAHRVVGHSRRLIALGILGLTLFIYFTDNRVTGSPQYVRLHQAMWASQPVVGALAAHWTVNAQGLVYPFTRKLRPAWLDFDHDPLAWLPPPESSRRTADAPPAGQNPRESS